MSAPYYESNGVTIYHADNRDVLPALCGRWMTLTDPPYGISHPTDYGRRRKRRIKADCIDWPRVVGDDRPFDPTALAAIPGQHVLWGANYYADRLPAVSGWLVWDKDRPDGLDQSTCELAWTDCIKGVRRFRHRWHGFLRASERGRVNRLHPTQKPVALMRWCLEFRWVDGALPVLDPYMGSGPVLRAAQALGRQAVGIEIDERYCETAARRLESEAAQAA